MRVIQLKTAAIGPKEKQALDAAFADLKSKMPQMAAMLSNPNVQKLLIAVFDQIAANPNMVSAFVGDIKNIQSGRANDSKAATPVGVGAAT